MSFTSKSESVEELETRRCGATGPATVMSSSRGALTKVMTSGALEARPSAVHPGSHGDGVEDAGIVFLDGVEGAERSGQILSVEPSADGEHGAFDVLELRCEVARAPVFVVGVVLIGVVEERVFD